MKVVYLVLGMGMIALGLLIYLATWFILFPSILPAGRYPVILAAIPALPLIWPAWIFLKKAGIQWGTYPTSTTRLYVIAFVIFLGIFIAAVFLGLLDE
jgi:hypothetical protein